MLELIPFLEPLHFLEGLKVHVLWEGQNLFAL